MKTTTAQTTAQSVEKPKFEIEEVQFDDFGFEKDELTGGYDEVFFVKIRTKDAAYFEFSKKAGDKILKDPRITIQTVEGKLVKVELGSYTYENKDIKTLKLHITKEIGGRNVLFIVSTSFTQVARSIINSLLGHTKSVSKVNITVYKNQSGYTSVKMSIDGAKSMWKYSIEDMRNYIETIKNKKGEFVSNDYSDLDDIFEQKLREHLGILFPEQEHIRFVEEPIIKDEEATFGIDDSNDAESFFNIGDES